MPCKNNLDFFSTVYAYFLLKIETYLKSNAVLLEEKLDS